MSNVKSFSSHLVITKKAMSVFGDAANANAAHVCDSRCGTHKIKIRPNLDQLAQAYDEANQLALNHTLTITLQSNHKPNAKPFPKSLTVTLKYNPELIGK